MKLLGLLLLAALSLNANAAKKSPCSDEEKLTEAVVSGLVKLNDPQVDPAQFVKTADGLDEFIAETSYNDECHRSVTIYMKAGTCVVGKKAKKGKEVCTDD
ncbi:MAG: hypothetical protein ACXVBE_09660 [Bdellovibrionota bacterium]